MARFLQGGPAEAVGLFRHFVREYRTIGPFRLHPAKIRIAFVAKIRFSGVRKIGDNFIEGGFLFDRRYGEASCFYGIEHIPGTHFYAHHFGLRRKHDVTPELKKYMRMAYDIGVRKHIKKTTRPS